jgi:hypothetical protein
MEKDKIVWYVWMGKYGSYERWCVYYTANQSMGYNYIEQGDYDLHSFIKMMEDIHIRIRQQGGEVRIGRPPWLDDYTKEEYQKGELSLERKLK